MRYVLYVLLSCFILLFNNSCKKKCEGDGSITQSFVTQDNWQWFNFPEGTRIAYENNLGERDTAVFGPINVINERGYHDSKKCNTVYTQKITQDIKWVKGLKGRIRPIQLIGKGKYLGTKIEYNEISLSDLSEKDFTDTLTYNNIKLNDVYKTECNAIGCEYKSVIQSKSKFFLIFSYRLSNNSTETWSQK